MNSVTKDQLQQMQREQRDVVLINVLDHDEFIHRHIAGSVNVPYNQPQFVQIVTSICAAKNREIVVYGDDAQAAEKAARKLEDAGFAKVYGYRAGVGQWFGEGEAADNQRPELPREHRQWLDVVGAKN